MRSLANGEAALPIVWFIDGAWNRLRRLTPRMMTHDPNHSTDSRERP